MDVGTAADFGLLHPIFAQSCPEALEVLSGMSRLTAIPVEVGPAEGALTPGSWTGLE
ncbi:MAG: hypothetical protein GY910_19980 [bacterium]|nr:hypothetical protein [bacterium]